jgi:hypothetical protein
MAGRDLDPREIAAADLVMSMIGGRAVPKDDADAPEKTVDFLIEDLPNLRTAALEVTSIADPKVVSQLRAAFGRAWSSPDLSLIWAVALSRSDPNQNITRLVKTMTPLLVMFEQEGETKVEVDYSPRYRPKPAGMKDEMNEARITMFDNGVSRAQVWNTPEQGNHGEILFMIREGVSSDPGLLNDLVTDRAKKKVEKLRATEATERHLFIWMDSTYPSAELAFATLPPPPAPSIPNDVDVVWLVEPTGWPNHVRIWRLRHLGEWEVVNPAEGYTLKL